MPESLITVDDPRLTEAGFLCWHSSDPDGGPDVGISMGLGQGRMLWAGEISRSRHAEGGEEVAALGCDGGWWILLYGSLEVTIVGKAVDAESAREMIEAIGGAASRDRDGSLRRG